MYLLSILVFLILCILFMLFCTDGGFSSIIYFIDMPTIVMFALLVVPMMIIAGVMKDFNNAFRLGARMKKQAKRMEVLRSLEAVSYAIKVIWAVGIFCFLIPTMNTFMRMSGNLEVLLAMKHIAVGSIPLCYASIITVVLLPLHARLKRRLDELCEENNNITNSAEQESGNADGKQSE